MKQLLGVVVLIGTAVLTLATPGTMADVLAIKGDLGVWRTDFDGTAGDSHLSDLGFSDENSQYFHLYAEHPVPLIPNFRLAYADITSTQSLSTAGAGLYTAKMDFSHIDATAYYELLDNWVNLDAGISIRTFDGGVSFDSLITSEKLTIDEFIPMLYLLGEVDLPFTGWSVGLEVNYTEFDDYRISDTTAKVRYLFEAVLDLGFEAGIRQFTLDLDKSFGVDVDLNGPYLGLVAQF